jgi:N-acetylmuramoyl-L-alanine amidase
MIRALALLPGILLFAGSIGISAQAQPSPSVPAEVGFSQGRDAQRSRDEGNDILPVVLGARVGNDGDHARFVIEVSDPFRMRLFTLASPDRVVVDMPEVLWRLNHPPRPSGGGLIRSYRYGLFRAGNSRLVIDLNRPAAAAEPLVLPPDHGQGYRIVIDLAPISQRNFQQLAGWPSDLDRRELAAVQSSAGKAPASPAGTSVKGSPRRLVVIDPGHGGIDSGTVGFDGIMEKNLVLDEGLRLQAELAKRGYSVRLTRDTDVYVPLQERVNIARALDADLLISLHADSNPDPKVSGASVYTLSESGSDREAAALARKENQSDVIAGVDLSAESTPVASILIGLAQRDTLNQSSRFAQAAVEALSHATDVLARDPHRSAAFAVLKAPDVPAVLVEMGYLSNPHDCARARTSSWRDGIASAIADAIDRQFESNSVPAAANKQAAE